MAGIGFELKRLFAQKGIVLQMRANLYAGMVVAGPMIMGALLLFGAKFIAVRVGGATPHQQDLIIVVITYSLLFSLLTTSILLFVLARYIADSLYIDAEERILPSMYGAIAILLVLGGLGWGIFLLLSKLQLDYSLLSFFLFCEGIVVWIQINYITAVKDYRSIFNGFLIALVIGLSVGLLLTWLGVDVVFSLLLAACITYMILMLSFTRVLHKFFPMGSGTSFKFLEWIDEYPNLPFVGFAMTLGLFIHLMIMWASPWGTQVEGWFYHAPSHDIPALFAFLTSLVSSINFVTSVEVNFYPKYRIYFGLLNGDGSLVNIEKAYDEMMNVLKQELFNLGLQQIFVTVLAIVVVGELLSYLQLGFSLGMIGLFRVLCIGYGLYAIGNSMMLFLLYFANNRDAMLSAITLLVVNTVGTAIVIKLPEVYYGFGFVLAGMAFYIVSLRFLQAYTRKLDFHTFSKQPIFFVKKKGIFRPLVRRLENQQ